MADPAAAQVVALQREVARLKTIYGEAAKEISRQMLRAEFAEAAMESKANTILSNSVERETSEELEIKLKDAQAQLEGARKRADNASKAKLEFKIERDQLNYELGEARTKEKRRDREFDTLREELADARRHVEEASRREREISREKDELKKDLEEAKRKVDSLASKAVHHVWEKSKLEEKLDEMKKTADNSDSMKLDLEREVNAVRDKLAGMEEKVESSEREKVDLARDNDALLKELADSTVAIDKLRRDCFDNDRNLTHQLEVERRQAVDVQKRDRARIAELEQCLEQYERAWRQELQLDPRLQQQQQPHPHHMASLKRPYREETVSHVKNMKRREGHEERMRQPRVMQQQQAGLQQIHHHQPPQHQMQLMQHAAAPAQQRHPSPMMRVEALSPYQQLDMRGHPTNLFQLCDATSEESVMLDVAVKFVRSELEKHGREHIEKRPHEVLSCVLCMWKGKNAAVLDHFLTSRHLDAMSTRDAAVSLPALNHWLGLLEPIKAAAAAAAAGRKK